MRTHVIILAGGKGTRMKSDRPKALSDLAGKPVIARLLESVTKVCPRPTIVVGHGGDEVRKALGDGYHYVVQEEQLGTGHAVAVTREELARDKDIANIVVLYGDHPFVSEKTIRDLAEEHRKSGDALTIATLTVPNFEGDYRACYAYGRVVRDETGRVQGIVELKDATEAEREMKEVNPGYYCFSPDWLWENIVRLENKNKAGEYYLTDIVGLAASGGARIGTTTIEDLVEGMGVNTPEELQVAERYLGRRATTGSGTAPDVIPSPARNLPRSEHFPRHPERGEGSRRIKKEADPSQSSG